jgi:hypothetical protein
MLFDFMVIDYDDVADRRDLITQAPSSTNNNVHTLL